jgi:hypothetical protein
MLHLGRVRSRNDVGRVNRKAGRKSRVADSRVAPKFDLRQGVRTVRDHWRGSVASFSPSRPVRQHSYSCAVPESVCAPNGSGSFAIFDAIRVLLAIDLGQCHQIARLIIIQCPSLPELRTYNCKRCTVTVNGSEETERAARWSEGAPLLLDHGPKGGDPGWQLKSQASTGLPKTSGCKWRHW